MIKNYLRVAIRNLIKNKSYVIINTFGLGISLACCITAYILVAYNLEFNDFHKDEKVANIFRSHTHILFSDGNIKHTTGNPILVGPLASQEIAGIERFTRFSSLGTNVSFGDKAFGEGVSFADSSFFEMFDFPLTAGSHTAFKDLHSIFISEELAEKYFLDEDPIGKILTLSFPRGVEKKLIVGGVIKEFPINTSIRFSSLMRMEHFAEMRKLELQPWADWNLVTTYFELTNPDLSVETAKQFDKYIPLRNEAYQDQEVKRFGLEHFKSTLNQETQSYAYQPYINVKLNNGTIVLFSSMAFLILLIACFNLTNTSIAMTAGRLKEIGVRKSVGAYKGQIIIQFLLETMTMMTLSVIAGYLMSNVIVTEFTTMWGFPYGLEDLNVFNLIAVLLVVMLIASVLAGIYPALFNSKFNSVALLKGTVAIKGTNALTKTLVSIQFAISVIVLIAGISFMQNAKYQESIRFGYDQEQIVSISIQNEREFFALEAKAIANPKVKNVSVSSHQVGWSTYTSPVQYENVDYNVKHIGVHKNYFETMGFSFIMGRSFDTNNVSELGDGLVVSKAFIKFLNIEDDPIGKQITVHGSKKKILGVIDDFVDNVYQTSDPEPFVFYPSIEPYWQMMIVKAEAQDLKEVNEYLEASWKEMYPTKPYQSNYQEDILLQGTKRNNGNMSKIFLFLTILGCILSVSGIFALASLNVVKRTKEIGIRRVVGGSVSSVIKLLNKEFVIILTISGLLGALGGYYGTEFLLDDFYAFYKSTSIITIVLCALFIFLIGITTTSLTIFKAARANPVDTLRDE